MENLLIKFDSLDQFSQKLVADFIDLLLKRQNEKKLVTQKKGSEKGHPSNAPFDFQAYRNQLLSLKPWTKEEIQAFDENRAMFQKMTLKEW